MVLGPLSEFYGRRPIYIASFGFFLTWLIPSAVAHNIATMLISRFLDGLAGSAFLSVAGGTVGDLFNRQHLQAPMMIYTASPFVGPSVGPLIGGFINEYTSWRWTFYVLIIWSGVMLASIVILVPETYHPVVLRNKARKLRKETGEERWKAPIEKTNKSISRTILYSLIRPFQLLTLEPMCLNLCLYSAILLGVLYLFFGAFAVVFRNNHGFTLSQIGMSFLGILVGMVAGILTDSLWHKNYVRLVRNREIAGGEPGGSEPEYRLPPAILGGFLVPIGLFWFGWTTYSSVHWIVPIIGSVIFGMG
jgi:multidrug resistance protein